MVTISSSLHCIVLRFVGQWWKSFYWVITFSFRCFLLADTSFSLHLHINVVDWFISAGVCSFIFVIFLVYCVLRPLHMRV